jgi:hypothetical protein
VLSCSGHGSALIARPNLMDRGVHHGFHSLRQNFVV